MLQNKFGDCSENYLPTPEHLKNCELTVGNFKLQSQWLQMGLLEKDKFSKKVQESSAETS
jgi:hypothetical protein